MHSDRYPFAPFANGLADRSACSGAPFTPAEHANFLGAEVVAAAPAFLDGRHDSAELCRNAHALFCELIAAPDDDAAAKQILVPSRLLVVAMSGAVRAHGAGSGADEARQDRWMAVMGALVELVRQESREAKHVSHARANGVRL